MSTIGFTINQDYLKNWMVFLLEYFKNMRESDNQIENLRRKLSYNYQFSPKELFNYLDKNNKGFLHLADFQEFLNEQKKKYNPLYLRVFIKNFDKDNDFKLGLKEFLEIVLLRGNKYRKQSLINSVDQRDPFIDDEIISTFRDIVLEELNLIEKICDNAIKCRSAKRFITYEAYYHIVGKKRYITNEDLYKFFRLYNIVYDINECDNIMYRIDQDWDGKISYEEWVEIFFPAILESSAVKDYNISFGSFKDIKTVKDLSSYKEENPELPKKSELFINKLDNSVKKTNNHLDSCNQQYKSKNIFLSSRINIQEERKDRDDNINPLRSLEKYDPLLNYKYSNKIRNIKSYKTYSNFDRKNTLNTYTYKN